MATIKNTHLFFTALITAVILALIIGTIYFINSDKSSLTVETDSTNPTKNITAIDKNIKTVGSEWQWGEFEQKRKKDGDSTIATNIESIDETVAGVFFDIEVIHHELQEVRIDNDGNVILDSTALEALNKTLNYSNIEFTQLDLETLQALIQVGLPGTAGEQTAEIVGDYYQYLQARHEFDSLYREIQNPATAKLHYAELQSLRKMYLGETVAQQLFQEQDKEALYMLESMALATNTELSPEERETQQKQLADLHHRIQPNIPNWEARHQAYIQQKQLILESGLTEEHQHNQLEELRSSHFTASELNTAQSYDLLQSN